MNITNGVKNIFLVLLFAVVAVETTIAMQGPAEAAPVTQAAKPQETHTCKLMITEEESCDQTFDNEREFYDHIEEHRQQTQKDSDGKFPCRWQNCAYKTAYKGDLHKHIKRHTGEKPFTCTLPGCRYRSSTQSALQAHTIRHSGKKLFKCLAPGCDYRSSERGNLQKHERTHTGEKPFKCTEPGCSYRAAQQSHLDTHIKAKHTEDKPFKCPEPGCGFSTARERGLETHIKNRHPNISLSKRSEIVPPNQEDTALSLVAPTAQYFCPYCGRYFDHESSFENHLLEHYGLQ